MPRETAKRKPFTRTRDHFDPNDPGRAAYLAEKARRTREARAAIRKKELEDVERSLNEAEARRKEQEPTPFAQAAAEGEVESPHAEGTNQFKPGHHVGRPKGSRNAITRDLKKGLIEAAVLHGYDGKGQGGLVGYLYRLAEKSERTFGGLLGKLMPLQMTGNVGLGITSIQIAPVPTDSYISADEAKTKALAPPLEEVADVLTEALKDHIAELDADNDDDGDDEDEREEA